MKKLIALVSLGIALSVSAPAFAGAQQNKMKTCNADAKQQALKGAERKAFMKTCLKKDSAASTDAAAPSPQQNKMKSCNAEAKAKALKGSERKAFMSSCLSA
ncbi:MAG: PsiF repeat-containing protein [Gallionellaceae bacterium]|nr:MAG: PsiF repeat-containing protein [Gallionellaceae bacterium]